VNLHKNARLTPAGRLRVVQRVLAGEAATRVATGAGVSVRTVWKWVQRYREKDTALRDRSSRPARIARQLPRCQRRQILRARRKRWSSLRIATHYHLPVSTVVTVQRRLGLNRLRALEPQRPALRYEKRRPGQLLHVDVKRLGKIGRVGHRIHGDRRTRMRGIGWEAVHVAIDDCTRLGYAEVLPDERAGTTAGFLARAVAWYAAQRIRVRRIMTDNAKTYLSHDVQKERRRAGWRHVRIRPYTPRTNGKAERFIRTLLQEWAYVRAYRNSTRRALALPHYLRFYNTERRHTALGYTTPLQRLATKSVNNVFVINT
jgi:transposase InsO family protein